MMRAGATQIPLMQVRSPRRAPGRQITVDGEGDWVGEGEVDGVGVGVGETSGEGVGVGLDGNSSKGGNSKGTSAANTSGEQDETSHEL